ncbi:pitrilysin family protein [soil metagenome]
MSGLRFDEGLLPNGLRVVGEHNPRAESVAMAHLVETGGRDERDDEQGVSHFLEHLCFKGTARRGAFEVSRDFDALGARYNAFTSDELTAYYGAVLPEAAPELLELLTDMMRPSLHDDDVDVERNVVLEEIAMDADRPASVAFDRARERFFAGHPIRRALLGTTASIGALGADRVRAFHERRYRSGGMLVVLAGAYDWDATLRQLEEETLGWPEGDPGRDHPDVVWSAGRFEERAANVTRAHVALLAPGVGRRDERRHAAALLARAIGASDNSRLFWSLIEPGLADEASLWHDDADGFGSFGGYLSTDDASVERVLDVARDVFEGVQREGLERAEWARAQRTLATGLTLRGETPMGRLVTVGSAYLDRGRHESVASVVDELLSTPLEAGLALLAERPFDRACTYVVRPARTA